MTTAEAELFDLLHDLFGVGDWDRDLSEEPWWKFKALEVTKIKRSAKARRVDVADLALAARYCKAHGIDVRNFAWLYKHIPDALRWENARRRAAAHVDLDELIAQAIEVERENPDSSWLDRLVRARGDHRKAVYEQWKAR